MLIYDRIGPYSLVIKDGRAGIYKYTPTTMAGDCIMHILIDPQTTLLFNDEVIAAFESLRENRCALADDNNCCKAGHKEWCSSYDQSCTLFSRQDMYSNWSLH